MRNDDGHVPWGTIVILAIVLYLLVAHGAAINPY